MNDNKQGYDEEELVGETLEEERYEDELKSRLETSTEFGQFIITPTKSLKKAFYDKFLQKELAVSYIQNDEEIKLMMMYQQLTNNIAFLSLEGEKEIIDQKTNKKIIVPKFNPIIDVAIVYNSEKMAWLGLWRSRKGFEREKLTTITHVRKDVNKNQEQQGWFKRGQQ